jgi:hypothetical protein
MMHGQQNIKYVIEEKRGMGKSDGKKRWKT